MSSDLRIAIEKPDSAGINAVMGQLLAYNASRSNDTVPDYLFIAARDEAGTIKGGLVGATCFGWLWVHAMTLDESLRGQGHGSALLAMAEAEAVRRGYPRVFLETLDFQALPFYEKQGYQVHSRLDGFPFPSGTRYALTKML